MSFSKVLSVFSIKPSTVPWVMMLLVLMTAPLFPGKGAFGFFSVEWSFFVLSAIVMYVTLGHLLIHARLTITMDRTYVFLLVFLALAFFSLIDAQNRIRGILFLGQYIPYFFVFVLIITSIDDERKLTYLLNKFSIITFMFCIIIILTFCIGQMRSTVKFLLGYYFDISLSSDFFTPWDRDFMNDCILNNFNIAVNKVLTYIELPLCISLYSLLNRAINKYDLIYVVTAIFAIILTGSRGSILILVGMIGLCMLNSRRIERKVLVACILIPIALVGFTLSSYTLQRLQRIFVTSERDYQDNIESFSRLYTAEVAWRMMLDSPVNGVGLGNSVYQQLNAIRSLSLPPEILSYWEDRNLFETTMTPVRLGSELGIGGFLFFFVFYLYLFIRARKAFSHVNTSTNTFAKPMIIYIVVAFVHNFLDLGFMMYYSWFYYGAVIAACRICEKASQVNLRTGSEACLIHVC